MTNHEKNSETSNVMSRWEDLLEYFEQDFKSNPRNSKSAMMAYNIRRVIRDIQDEKDNKPKIRHKDDGF
jgi:hypothetical protein